MADDANVDVVIRGGTISDGSGNPPLLGDAAALGDTIVAVASGLDGRGQ